MSVKEWKMLVRDAEESLYVPPQGRHIDRLAYDEAAEILGVHASLREIFDHAQQID